MYYVYILLCNDGTYYTGCTQNLKERLERHGKSYVGYTKDNLPVKLVFYCAFPDKYKAYEFEKYLKSGSGIAFRNKHFVCLTASRAAISLRLFISKKIYSLKLFRRQAKSNEQINFNNKTVLWALANNLFNKAAWAFSLYRLGKLLFPKQ